MSRTKRIPADVENRIFSLKHSGSSNVEISDAINAEFGIFYSKERIRKCFIGTGYEKA